MARKRSSSKSSKKRTKKSGVKRRTWDPVQVAEQLAPAVAEMLGLDVLGLTEEQYVELLRDILVKVIGDRVTKPKADTLVKAIKRNMNKVMPAIVLKLLEIVPEGKLTPEQCEFAITYVGPLAVVVAPRLYREAKRLGLDPTPLQAGWEEGWRARGEEGPVGFCPRCGFRSVAPDGSCMVCGYTLSDKELKEATDFEAKFEEFLESADCKELKEALNSGSLYVSHASVSTQRQTKWDVEVLLSKGEREKLKEAYAERCDLEASKKKKLDQLIAKLRSLSETS